MNKTCGNCAYHTVITINGKLSLACVYNAIRSKDFSYLVCGAEVVDYEQKACNCWEGV